MTKYFLAYISTLVSFLLLDMVWLAWLARPLYVAEMGGLLRKEPNLTAATAFYLLYAAGLVAFAVMPGLRSGSAMQALLLGLGVGLLAYGTYDLTNLTVLEGYTVRIALIDMAWGAALSGAVSALVVGVFNVLGRT